MKKMTSWAALIAVSGLLGLLACNSGTDEKKEEPKTDSPAVAPPAAPVNLPGPSSVMIVRHKVADYDKWKTGYDLHDSARLANGLHNYVICRGIQDPNMVMVALIMDDVTKAKAFAASKDLKDRMKSLGISGTPVIDFLEATLNDTSHILATTRTMVRHKVKDWDAWKKEFDSHKQARMDAGLEDRVIAHTAGDTHNVTLVFAVNDQAKADAFMKSDDLKNKMKAAGVMGAPDVYNYKVVQKY
jgi:hypothetical protein